MDNKLKLLVDRIEKSGFSDAAKAQLYTAISGGLQASIWPVLMTYVPEADLAALQANPNDKATVLRYASLIGEAVEHGNALAEMEDVMNRLLDEVDAALREEHI